MYVPFHPTPPVRVAKAPSPKISDLIVRIVPEKLMTMPADVMHMLRPMHTPQTIRRELHKIENPNVAKLKHIDGLEHSANRLPALQPDETMPEFLATQGSLLDYQRQRIEALELFTLPQVRPRAYEEAAIPVIAAILRLPIEMRPNALLHIMNQMSENTARSTPKLHRAISLALYQSLREDETLVRANAVARSKAKRVQAQTFADAAAAKRAAGKKTAEPAPGGRFIARVPGAAPQKVRRQRPNVAIAANPAAN